MAQEDFLKIKEQLEQSTGQKLSESQIHDLLAEIYRSKPFLDQHKKQVAVNIHGQVYTSNEEMINATECTRENCNGRQCNMQVGGDS